MDDGTFQRRPAEEKIAAHEADHGPEVVPQPFSTPSPAPQSTDKPYDGQHVPQPAAAGKGICGLRRSTFFLTILLAVVVIAAAVGGGVGGSLAVHNARKQAEAGAQGASATGAGSPPSQTESATGAAPTGSPTTSGRITVPTTGLLALDCPALSSERKSKTVKDKTYSFDMQCGADIQGTNVDIIAIVSYSVDDCLTACSSHNVNTGTEDCAGVVFNANLTYSLPRAGGNCFLKNNKGRLTTQNAKANLYVSGTLAS